jgi:hypothetical protein
MKFPSLIAMGCGFIELGESRACIRALGNPLVEVRYFRGVKSSSNVGRGRRGEFDHR